MVIAVVTLDEIVQRIAEAIGVDITEQGQVLDIGAMKREVERRGSGDLVNSLPGTFHHDIVAIPQLVEIVAGATLHPGIAVPVADERIVAGAALQHVVAFAVK